MIQLGTWVIDTALQVITKNELSNANNQWQRAHLSSVISRQATVKACQTEVLLDLNLIHGYIKTARRITIPPLETGQVQGLTKVRCHMKRVPVMMDIPAQLYSKYPITTSTFADLTLRSSKITICMRNFLARPIKIPAKMTMGFVSTANIVPPLLASKIKTNEDIQEKGTDVNIAKLSEEKLQILIRLVQFGKLGSGFTERGQRFNS